jgi:hypothetical protein
MAAARSARHGTGDLGTVERIPITATAGAEFERGMIRARTTESRARAKANGVKRQLSR